MSYLPIYEYVIDELRDYSFFKDDLVHPNEKAVEFVWQKITQHLFSEELVCYEKEASKIIQSINHKSLYPKSSQNVKFLMTILDQLSNLENKFSVEWGPEKETVNSRLKELA